MPECQRAAQDIHQDCGNDLPDDESLLEAHFPRIDGDANYWPHSEHLRHTLPGETDLYNMLNEHLDQWNHMTPSTKKQLFYCNFH